MQQHRLIAAACDSSGGTATTVAKATQSHGHHRNPAAILLPSSNQIRATLFEDGRSH
jgi:hypothetical protein